MTNVQLPAGYQHSGYTLAGILFDDTGFASVPSLNAVQTALLAFIGATLDGVVPPSPSNFTAGQRAELLATYAALVGGALQIGGNPLLPSAIGADAAGAAAAVQATQGVTIGTSSVVNGAVRLTFSTPWGLRANGTAYYDPAGAAAGEQAALDINPSTGAPRLTLIAS